MPKQETKKQAFYEWLAMSDIDKVVKKLPTTLPDMCQRLGINKLTGFSWQREWREGNSGDEKAPETIIEEIMGNLRRLSKTHPTAGKAYIEAHKLLGEEARGIERELSGGEIAQFILGTLEELEAGGMIEVKVNVNDTDKS